MAHWYIDSAKKVIELEREALTRVSDRLSESFEQSVSTIISTLEKKGKVVVIGVGKSGNIGHKIAATLNSTGTTAVVLNSQNALHGDLGLLSEEDTVLALSYSGETNEMITLLPFIKRIGVTVIALTSSPESTLGKYSDYVLDSSVEREACPLNLAPTSSSTAMLALGDALAMVLLEARNFTEEDFARFHPSGSLGRALLTTAEHIMRTGNELPWVSPSALVVDALKEMSKKRAGACLVIDNQGGLSGIFTHGDFVRGYQSLQVIGEQVICDYMTTSPVTICSSVLAAEAVKSLQDHRIDDLIVVDEYGKPVGLIDSQDLAHHKII